MNDTVQEEFTEGVEAYWSGELPEGWDDYSVRSKSPFLVGWYMASMWENMPGYLTDRDGEPLQED